MTTSETATLAIWLIVRTVDVFANRRTGDGKRAGPVSTDNRADTAENSVCGNRRSLRCTMPDFAPAWRFARTVRTTSPAVTRAGTKAQAMANSVAMRIAIPARRGVYQTPSPHERCQPKPFGLRMCRIDARPATERKMRWRDSGRRNRRERTGARCRVRGADVCPARRKRFHRYKTRLRQTARKYRPREGP